MDQIAKDILCDLQAKEQTETRVKTRKEEESEQGAKAWAKQRARKLRRELVRLDLDDHLTLMTREEYSWSSQDHLRWKFLGMVLGISEWHCLEYVHFEMKVNDSLRHREWWEVQIKVENLFHLLILAQRDAFHQSEQKQQETQ